jgi:hypothetical protein
MSFAIRFELVDHVAPGPVSGLSRGDVTITGPLGAVTSAGRRPDQSMLVYISIVDLLDGLGALLRPGGGRHWEWVGNDSSFVVDFDRRGDRVRIRAMGEDLGEVAEADLITGVWDATTTFLATNRPGRGDMVAIDLDDAVEDLRDRLIGKS